jgi:hypothetical protein
MWINQKKGKEVMRSKEAPRERALRESSFRRFVYSNLENQREQNQEKGKER